MRPPLTNQPPDRTSAKDAIASVLAIAAVYVYFLVFAEFAFIENLRAIVQEGGLKPLMAALGLAGIAGSIVAAKWFSSVCGPQQLSIGFIGCALSAGLSLLAQNLGMALAAAVLVGGSVGWTTVILVLCLRPTVKAGPLGLCCGVGTGLAYALCNQPLVFNATPRMQTWFAVFSALAGLAVSLRLRSGPTERLSSQEYRPVVAAVWFVLFFALVWLDSAAFFIIQRSESLKAGTWTGQIVLQSNAIVHLVAAVVTGWSLDRQKQSFAIGTALTLLLGACMLLRQSGDFFPAARAMYTAGVSIYSTSLVFYPAQGGRPWLAGGLFAAAGWFGSAMGIGMAQSLQTIPITFVIIVAVIASIAFFARHLGLKRLRAGTGAATLLFTGVLFTPQDLLAEDPIIKLGRETYISEGCIHCHSQYVRPGTADVERWGPTIPLAKSLPQKPPLYGNRRQGPDLSQVGSRRTPEWNRLHLISPRSLTPKSRMPSYAYLFKNDNPRGPALVAYLATLGAENTRARLEVAQAWRPSVTTTIFAEEKQRVHFAELCSSCHGLEGRGDGPLAARLSLRPPDFTRDPWRHTTESDPLQEVQLARIVKFGQPNTPMAGHEYLSNEDIASLVNFVVKLHQSRQKPQ